MQLPGFPCRRFPIAALAVICLLLAGMSSASAQLLIKPDDHWRYSLGAGGSVSSGNSSSQSVNITADALKATERDKWTLYGRLLYGESDDETTADQANAGGRYDRELTQAWFAFGLADWLRDRPANLSNRWSASTGLGYHLIKEDPGFWDVFAGLGYTHDALIVPTVVSDELRSSYGRAELLFGEESQYQLTGSTTVKQRLVIFPNLDDTSNFRGVLDTSLAVAMTERFNLTASLGYRYNSDPGAALRKVDLLFVTGITVKIE